MAQTTNISHILVFIDHHAREGGTPGKFEVFLFRFHIRRRLKKPETSTDPGLGLTTWFPCQNGRNLVTLQPQSIYVLPAARSALLCSEYLGCQSPQTAPIFHYTMCTIRIVSVCYEGGVCVCVCTDNNKLDVTFKSGYIRCSCFTP